MASRAPASMHPQQPGLASGCTKQGGDSRDAVRREGREGILVNSRLLVTPSQDGGRLGGGARPCAAPPPWPPP